MNLPAPVVPMSEVALIDEAAVALGCDLGVLMERAGELLANEAMRRAPQGTILIATGPGNNGGDGWVAARHLAAAGRKVLVWPVCPPKAELCVAASEKARPLVCVCHDPPPERPALIIDAILGAGQSGPPRPEIVTALDRLSGLKAPVLAADVPTALGHPSMLSGADSLCFQVAKAELMRDIRVGEFKTVDIGIPPAAWQDVPSQVVRLFPPLMRDGHKGTHGELLVVGGGAFPGALHLACIAALCTGCDQVRAFTVEGPPLPPSIIVHRQPGRTLVPSDPGLLSALLVRARAVLIGPGLGRDPGAPEAAGQAFSLARELEVPVVVDADGITALASDLRRLKTSPVPVVVTPHAGEARALMNADPDEAAVHAFARPDRVILRKGVVDFISNGRRWQRNRHGNPRMAVGGTGDCLAGLTAGFLARGLNPFDASRLAVFWLTTAADELWLERGPCYKPEDVVDRLPTTLRRHMEPLGIWPPVTG